MGIEHYEVRSYIEHFRRHNGTVLNQALLDEMGRLAKAAKIRAIIGDFSPAPLTTLDCLDIGCSTGHITNDLAKDFRRIVGIDTDHRALAAAGGGRADGCLQRSSALAIPSRAESFDVVICNHVYEHVGEQQILFDEIRRVLRPGGFCYLAAGNRLKLIEPHYRLPLLSWLPKPLAHKYLRMSGRGDFYVENHLTVGGLRRLVTGFELFDYTLKLLREPRKFGGGDPLLSRMPSLAPFSALLRLIYFALPTYIWILRKPLYARPSGS